MNEDKELEEAIIFLMKVAKDYKIYGDLDNPEFEDVKKIPEAIETALQALEKLKEENYILKNRQGIGMLKEINVENLSEVLSTYYIPKKKMENKIKELEEIFVLTSRLNNKYLLSLDEDLPKNFNATKNYETMKKSKYQKEILQGLLEDEEE